MEEHNPIPHRSRRHHSTETSTISTSSEASSSHIPKLAQVVSTNPGLSTIVETESSQLPMVTIHPICETIPPEPNVVQLEVDPDPIVL